MKTFKKIYCRTFQFCFKIGMCFLNYRAPVLVKGSNALLDIPKILKTKEIANVFIVTDSNIVKLGLIDALYLELEKENIKVTIFDQVIPNPTISNVEMGLKEYQNNQCQAIVAVGGGSPMDCAKMIGARASNPKLSVLKMRGQLKVRKQLPLFIAVPTTAGTGSETTLAAVITNDQTSEKFAINDLKLIPNYAVLDPMLTLGLPKNITSTTGMDALTHAVEAYIGHSNTRKTKQYALEAVKLIKENLLVCYNEADNKQARMNMLEASFKAGVSFSRAYVGYVHAIAHSLGGLYHVPHGLANAIVLPIVLKRYKDKVYRPLAKMADNIALTKVELSDQEKAESFIIWIEEMNQNMGIPNHLEGIIVESDINYLASEANREANPLYPVPLLLDKEELSKIYYKIGNIKEK